MRTLALLIPLLLLAPKARMDVHPRIKLLTTDERGTFNYIILHEYGFYEAGRAAVLETRAEDVDGRMTMLSRSVWNGYIEGTLTIAFSPEYYILRSQNERGKRLPENPFIPQEPSNVSPFDGEWDGTVQCELLLRAPRKDDFPEGYPMDKVKAAFGRADGKVYLKAPFVVKLNCPMCALYGGGRQ